MWRNGNKKATLTQKDYHIFNCFKNLSVSEILKLDKVASSGFNVYKPSLDVVV